MTADDDRSFATLCEVVGHGRFEQDQQYEGRNVDPAHARQDPPRRHDQRIGHADDELRKRVVKVRPNDLQHEAKQEDEQVQVSEGLDQKK